MLDEESLPPTISRKNRPFSQPHSLSTSTVYSKHCRYKDPQELERPGQQVRERGTMFARLLLSWVICGFITRRLFVFDDLRHRLQEPEHSIVVHVICVALGINFTKRSFLGFILWTLFTKAFKAQSTSTFVFTTILVPNNMAYSVNTDLFMTN